MMHTPCIEVHEGNLRIYSNNVLGLSAIYNCTLLCMVILQSCLKLTVALVATNIFKQMTVSLKQIVVWLKVPSNGQP